MPNGSGVSKKELKGLLGDAKQMFEDLEDEEMNMKKMIQILKEIAVGVELAHKKLDLVLKNQGVVVK
jgi:hypothetical protein